MTESPSYPEDSPVGEARAAAAAAGGAEKARNRRIATSAAIGIGSAALVAALLYANRSRKVAKPDD